MARALSTIGYSLDVNMTRILDLIQRSGANRIGLQAPEGLKRVLPEIAREISEKTNAEVIVSGDPCFGACDIDLELCRKVDLLFHLGHSEPETCPDNVIFLETRMDIDIDEALKKALPLIKSDRVVLVTTVQHAHKLSQALEILKNNRIEGLVGLGCSRVKYAGQILGCCYCSARDLDADEILFIGTGNFHPLGIAIATGKKVIAADPVIGEARIIDPNPMLKQRFGTLMRAKHAMKFAVLVSKKLGQQRWKLANQIKKLGEAAGREMLLIYIDNVEPEQLLNLGIKAAVSTACPRVALDDISKFKIPILTPPEFEILLGERRWEDYIFDEIA